MQNILTIISSVSFSALLAAALIFLTKSWISERIKNAIKHEYDEKLETHKAQLKLVEAERRIRLTRVFEKTAETIATTYAKLWAFHKAVEDCTQSGDHSDFAHSQELKMSIQSKHEDVCQYFLPRKIYFPKETARKIIDFLNAGQSASGEFAMMLISKGNLEATEKIYKRFTEDSKEFSELLTLLEEDFQRILGMEERKSD
jgi:hypothetical protein